MEKKEFYLQQIRRLRADKIEENRKKIERYGYNEGDDTNMLALPEGYNWQPVSNHENGDFYVYMGWATNYASFLKSFPPVVVPYSSMAGNSYGMLCNYRKTCCPPELEQPQFDYLWETYASGDCRNAFQHYCGDCRIGLTIGWGGLREKIVQYAQLHENAGEETDEFYRAELVVVDAIIDWIGRTCEKIEELWQQETDPWTKQNLWDMLQVNRKIETGVPTTFREACQFLCWYHIAGRTYNGDAAGFRLDEILLPYYEKDKREGRIDDEDAIFYLVGLLLSDTRFHQLGGVDADGNDRINELSWLILEAADRLDVSLNLTIGVHAGMDRAFFRRGVELLFRHHNGWPRFYGVDSINDGFVKLGFDRSLACQRVMGGCQWFSVPGAEYTTSDANKVNFAKIMEIAFAEVMTEDVPSVERLWERYKLHLARVIDGIKQATDVHIRTHRYNYPELFLNLFSHGPIEQGTDASNHSLSYYNIGIDGTGIAVAADSFAALEQRIEQEGKLTWQQVAQALQRNFEGETRQIRTCLQTAGKYGQTDNLAQKWAKMITACFADLVCNGDGEEGEKFIPGMFSWIAYVGYGKAVGATPDGRAAGEPLNQGANPMPGSVKNGEMTAMSESILAAQCGYGNSSPFQLDIDPMVTDVEGGIDKIMALIAVHLARGGTLVNVNVLDSDKILQANEHPELFPDLVVRVTGYSAYFLSLSPELRQIVVDRVIQAM